MALRKVTTSQEQPPAGKSAGLQSQESSQLLTDPVPVFIFGCGRSGTSLLSRMLNQHPRIAVPYESHLFNTFYGWLPLYGDLHDAKNLNRLLDDILSTDVMQDWDPGLSPDEIRARLTRHDFAGVFDAILSAYALKTGKARWGEKTPQHIYFWDQISEHFPEARVIHIVRDGRDVALSLLRARFGPKSIYGCAIYWNKYLLEVAKLKKIIPAQNIHQMYYEALLKNPEEELRQLCDFIEEDFFPDMLDFHKNKSRYKTDPQNQQNLMTPLLTDNNQKWRREMSERQLHVFESISGDFLQEYGYECATGHSASLHPFCLCYYRFVETPFLKVIAMLKNRKGHRDALIRLGIYLRLYCVDRFQKR